MADPIKIVLAYCRSNAYLAMGVCLGLCLSPLLAPGCADDCSSDRRAAGVSSYVATTVSDEYAPKINIEGKPRRAQKRPEAFVRPRYYSTELGIREKIFVGVVAGREYLHSRGVASNKTLAHLVDRIRYFISVPEGAKPNVTLPGIVGFTDTRSILKPFHVMKYITDNYLEDYDYYFITKDTSFVNGRKLLNIVNGISVSRDVHLGVNVVDRNYCALDAGILLSNSVVKKLKTSLDWCVENAFSSSDDVNFGRCVLQASDVPCSGEIQGKLYRAIRLPTTFDFEDDFEELTEEKMLSDAVSVYPLFDHRAVHKMNAYFATIELKRVEREIDELRRSMIDGSRSAPVENRKVSWPVGNQPGNRAPGRFDLLPWIYFNETHSFMDTDFENIREIVGSAKYDLEILLRSATTKIEKEYEGERLVYQRMVNGYRRFDASRGMDYILDLQFLRVASEKKIIKRIQVCKPLGKVEILPAPYVTENSRINMILVVDASNRTKTECLDFLKRYEDACLDKKDKTFLMLVLLYDPDSPSKGTTDIFYDIKQRALELTERYKKDRSKVTWLSIRLPNPSRAIRIDPILEIAVADLTTKKFTPESLLLFVEPNMDLKVEFLNRVRMNTIGQWQIYSPIPFVEYNPDVTSQPEYSDKQRASVDFDVNRNTGRYDGLNYRVISFYVKDYFASKRIEYFSFESPLKPAKTQRGVPFRDFAELAGNYKNVTSGELYRLVRRRYSRAFQPPSNQRLSPLKLKKKIVHDNYFLQCDVKRICEYLKRARTKISQRCSSSRRATSLKRCSIFSSRTPILTRFAPLSQRSKFVTPISTATARTARAYKKFVYDESIRVSDIEDNWPNSYWIIVTIIETVVHVPTLPFSRQLHL